MNVNPVIHTVGLLFLTLLGACANMQQAQIQGKQKDAQQYCASLYSEARLEPIRGKVPFQLALGQSIPMEMMSNSQFPTEEETQAILTWAQLRQDCFTYQTQVLGQPPAHYVALRMANNQVIAELFAGRITYGQLAQQINQNQIAALQQDQAIRMQAQRDAVQAQQAFSQQLFQQQQLNLQQQQLRNQQLQSRPINNSVNCTTQYIGNTAYTNCH